MKHRRYRQAEGQSIVLLALILVVLVAFVGLSMDVGNTYAQQRRMQSAANAAAVAGMAAWDGKASNAIVIEEIERALTANGVDYTAGSNYTFSVSYQLKDGTTLVIDALAGTAVQTAVERVVVDVRQDVDTYFARLVGRGDLPAIATGYGCIGGYNLGVYPIGVNVEIKEPLVKYSGTWNATANTGSAVVAKDAYWQDWHASTDAPYYQREYIKIPFYNKFDAMSGVHIPWLVWESGTNHSNSTLNAALSYPGNLGTSQFQEAAPPQGSTNGPRNGELEQGDWLDVNPGTRAANDTVIMQHATLGDIMILPMYSNPQPNGNGNSGNYVVQVVKMGAFRLIDADLSGGNKFIVLEYVGASSGSIVQCGSHPDSANASVSGVVTYDRLTATADGGPRASDTVLLLSVSENMLLNTESGGSMNLRKQDVPNSLGTFAVKLAEDSLADHTLEQNMKIVTYGEPAGVGLNATGEQPWLTGALEITTTVEADLTGALNKAAAGNQRPGALGLSKAEDFLRAAPGGSGNKKTVIMVVDGVMNVCKDGAAGICSTNGPAPATAGTQWESAAAQLNRNWPLWQAQEAADILHMPVSEGGIGAQVFVIVLSRPNDSLIGWVDVSGLRDIASGPGYFYKVTDKSELEQALADIAEVMIEGPGADTGHGDVLYCNPTSRLLPAGVQVSLVDDKGNVTTKTNTDAAGAFTFTGVRPGAYNVKVESTAGGLPILANRTYNRVFNYDDRSQAGGAISGPLSLLADKGASITLNMLLRGPVDNHVVGGAHTTDTGESGCKPY